MDPVVPLERNLYGHPKGTSRKFLWETDGEEFQIGNTYSLTERKDYSYLCVDDIKLAGKKQNISPTWKTHAMYFW